MGRSRSPPRFRESRPSDSMPSSSRDFDRERGDSRREMDYRGGGGGGYRDERGAYGGRGGDRGRDDRDRRGDRDDIDKRDVRGGDRHARDRSRSRSRGRSDRPVKLDEFGRVIDDARRRSMSPTADNRSRRFVPRMRSESPDREEEARLQQVEDDKPVDKNASLYQVNDDDDPETAAAKMEMEMMAKMGMPVLFDSTKGKGGAQSDAMAMSGGVRIKPQREHRQYMNRRCGFNKPLPSEATKQKFGIGSSSNAPKNTHW